MTILQWSRWLGAASEELSLLWRRQVGRWNPRTWYLRVVQGGSRCKSREWKGLRERRPGHQCNPLSPNQVSRRRGWGGAWSVLPAPTFPPPVPPFSVPLRVTQKGPPRPATALPGPDTFMKPTKWRPATTGPRILGTSVSQALVRWAGAAEGSAGPRGGVVY